MTTGPVIHRAEYLHVDNSPSRYESHKYMLAMTRSSLIKPVVTWKLSPKLDSYCLYFGLALLKRSSPLVRGGNFPLPVCIIDSLLIIAG